MNTILEDAINYRNIGLSPLPLKPDSKLPRIPWKALQSRPLTGDELETYFGVERNNIGILMGAVSDNLLVMDIDSRPVFDEYKGGLSHLLNQTLICDTRRGPHIYVKTPEPLLENPYEPIKGIDIKFNGYVVAPHSKVDGHQYTFFKSDMNIVRLESLAELPFTLKQKYDIIKQPRTRDDTPYKPFGISWKLFNVLKGKPESCASYKSRSEAEMALVTYCAAQGWTFDELLALFLMHAVQNTHFKAMGADAVRWLYGCFRQAQDYLSANHREIDHQIDALIMQTYNSRPSGRTGDTDRAVMLAVLAICKRTGKLEVGASAREIAEACGIGAKTASRALKRLPLKKIGMKATNIWKINWLCQNDTFLYSQVVKECGTNGTNSLSHDTFRLFGLNKNGLRLLEIMSKKGWLSFREIAELSGMAKRTLWRKLERMLVAGLVVREGLERGSRWRAIDNPDYDTAAAILGTAGCGKKQKCQHALEREGWNYYRKSRRLEREAWRNHLILEQEKRE